MDGIFSCQSRYRAGNDRAFCGFCSGFCVCRNSGKGCEITGDGTFGADGNRVDTGRKSVLYDVLYGAGAYDFVSVLSETCASGGGFHCTGDYDRDVCDAGNTKISNLSSEKERLIPTKWDKKQQKYQGKRPCIAYNAKICN